MSKKGDRRAEKSAEKLAKFEEDKQRTLDRVINDPGPKLAALPVAKGGPRLAPHLLRERTKQTGPSASADGSRFAKRVTWCLTKHDKEGNWAWGEEREFREGELAQVVQPAFRDFCALTWGQIDTFSSDTGHKLHHGHEIGDLAIEAQDRWREIGLYEFETVFRFRLGNKKRAWGFVLDAHFHFVWWERMHKIYET